MTRRSPLGAERIECGGDGVPGLWRDQVGVGVTVPEQVASHVPGVATVGNRHDGLLEGTSVGSGGNEQVGLGAVR